MMYTVPTTFRDSLYKKDSSLKGFYLYQGMGMRSWELGYDTTRINYLGGGSYLQSDTTMVYSTYAAGRKTFYGTHRISGDGDTYDGASMFAGVSTSKSPRVNVQLEGYVTKYPNIDSGLTVYQLSAGRGATNITGEKSSSYVQTRVNVIFLNNDVGLDQRKYYSAELSATRNRGRTSTTAFFRFGKEAFTVRNGGFAVLNKPEEQKSAFGLTLNHYMSGARHLTLGVTREIFSDTGADNSATAVSYRLMFGQDF